MIFEQNNNLDPNKSLNIVDTSLTFPPIHFDVDGLDDGNGNNPEDKYGLQQYIGGEAEIQDAYGLVGEERNIPFVFRGVIEKIFIDEEEDKLKIMFSKFAFMDNHQPWEAQNAKYAYDLMLLNNRPQPISDNRMLICIKIPLIPSPVIVTFFPKGASSLNWDALLPEDKG